MATEDNVVRLKHLSAFGSAILDKISDFTYEGGSSQATGYDAIFIPSDTSVIINTGGASVITVGGDTVTVTVEAEPVTVQADPKPLPILTLGSWSSAASIYSSAITYTGDGTLSANIGSISNGSLTVEDADGNFNGTITASEGTNYAPAVASFAYTEITVASGDADTRIEPILEFNPTDQSFTYDGDGIVCFAAKKTTVDNWYPGEYIRHNNSNNKIEIRYRANEENKATEYDLTISTTGTENYKPKSITVRRTAT